jgi:hypothetical protein
VVPWSVWTRLYEKKLTEIGGSQLWQPCGNQKRHLENEFEQHYERAESKKSLTKLPRERKDNINGNALGGLGSQ